MTAFCALEATQAHMERLVSQHHCDQCGVSPWAEIQREAAYTLSGAAQIEQSARLDAGSVSRLQVLAVQDWLHVLAVHVGAHAVLLGHLELPVALLRHATSGSFIMVITASEGIGCPHICSTHADGW